MKVGDRVRVVRLDKTERRFGVSASLVVGSIHVVANIFADASLDTTDEYLLDSSDVEVISTNKTKGKISHWVVLSGRPLIGNPFKTRKEARRYLAEHEGDYRLGSGEYLYLGKCIKYPDTHRRAELVLEV